MIAKNFGKITTGCCDVCRIDTEERCKIEHPEWFTPKRKERKLDHYSNIDQYLDNETPLKNCFVIESDECYDCGGYELAICSYHLKKLADEVG